MAKSAAFCPLPSSGSPALVAAGKGSLLRLGTKSWVQGQEPSCTFAGGSVPGWQARRDTQHPKERCFPSVTLKIQLFALQLLIA